MVESFTEQNAHSYAEMIKEILEALSDDNLAESSNGQNSPTYIEELSNDTSHASNEMVKQMIEVWTAIVGERSEQSVKLEGRLIASLREAFTEKFHHNLEKWKDYCLLLERSKFLMGEKASFKATLQWALKFDVIDKILAPSPKSDCEIIGLA